MSNYSDALLNDVLEKSFVYKMGKKIKIEFNSYPESCWIIGAFDDRGGFGVESCSWTHTDADSFPKHIYFLIDNRMEQKEISMELFGKNGLLNAYDSGFIYSISNIVEDKKILTPELFNYLKGLFDFYHDKCYGITMNKHYDNDDCCLGLSILCNKDYSQWFDNLFIENEELVKHLETNKKYDITEEVKSYYE